MPDSIVAALGTGAPWGLVAIAVIAVWRSWLIPAEQAERVVRLLEQQVTDYKAAWNAAEERGRIRDAQVEQLLTIAARQETTLLSMHNELRAKGLA